MIWHIKNKKNEQKVLWHKKCFYIFENFHIDVIFANYNNSLIKHFDIQKTLNLFQKKYFWFNFFNVFIEINYEKSNIKKVVKNIVKYVLFANEIKRRDTNYIINFNFYLYLNINETIYLWIL